LPAAQTMASATLDLPDPLGPTTTATPGSSLSSSVSGNDLKPRRRSERRCMRCEAIHRRGRRTMAARSGEYHRSVIGSPWVLLGIGAAAASALMVVLWLVELRIGDATHVDVGWTYGVGGLAVLDAALGDGNGALRLLVGLLAGAWSLRLGTYLVVNRLIG